MTETTRSRAIALSMFAVWLAAVLVVTWNHGVWRDEVRALSKALDGRNMLAMIRGIHAEGHPALWYLLLRGAHTVLPRPQVLQLIAVPVATASALLLVLYSPFEWWTNALLLASNFFLFEYSTVARNYGISMLLLILLAVCYEKHRNRGVVLGILLFLLANCNALSVVLVGGFLFFWLVDVATGDHAERPRALRSYAWNAAIAMVGVALCLLQILPAPAHMSPQVAAAMRNLDGPLPAAALTDQPGPDFVLLLRASLLPGTGLSHLLDISQGTGSYVVGSDSSSVQLLLSVLLFGSTLGLLRYPGALLAAVGTLMGFSLFFALVYTGFYRQEALWLVFLLVCYWITTARRKAGEPWSPPRFGAFLRPASATGWAMFLLLMGVQAQIGVSHVYGATVEGLPFSCSRDLAALIASRPELRNAIIMADPDNMLEALPYYLSNPTYYMRDASFGNYCLIRGSHMQLTLDDFLSTGRSLHEQTGRPVLILLSHPMDDLQTERIYREAHLWQFVTTPQQIRDFQGASELLESFPAALTDEKFDVYLLK